MANFKRYIDTSINRYIAKYISIYSIYWEKYIDIFDISINWYIATYISICPIYWEIYIDIFDILEEIYWQIIFFLNKHPSSPKHFPHQWQFFYLRKGLKALKRNNFYNVIFNTLTTFFTGYFLSPSVCHKNLRFCWKLLRTNIYYLELEKLIIDISQSFSKKLCKHENWVKDLYPFLAFHTIFSFAIQLFYKMVRNTKCKKPVSRATQNAVKNPLYTCCVSWLFHDKCTAG